MTQIAPIACYGIKFSVMTQIRNSKPKEGFYSFSFNIRKKLAPIILVTSSLL